MQNAVCIRYSPSSATLAWLSLIVCVTRYVRRSDKQKIAGYFHARLQPGELPLPSADYKSALTTSRGRTVKRANVNGPGALGPGPLFNRQLSEPIKVMHAVP